MLIHAAIHEVASAGTSVIVAHSASMALAEVPGVLRVLVTASSDVRAKRLSTTDRLAPEEADAAVAASDLERRDYVKRFYGVKEELPTHYDIVVNTDVLTQEATPAAATTAVAVPRAHVGVRPVSTRGQVSEKSFRQFVNLPQGTRV
jgi:cytidylate kinase